RHTRSDRDWSSDVCSSDLSRTCPDWSKLPNFEITDLRLPHMPGRVELFRKIFPEWVQPLVAEKEGNPDQALFTAAALEKRNPNRSEERRVGKEGRARWARD